MAVPVQELNDLEQSTIQLLQWQLFVSQADFEYAEDVIHDIFLLIPTK